MNTELWKTIESFSFDSPGADFSFSERLRRENGWSEEYTSQVLDEYRRFLFLCVEAGHPVTPSDQVDQAWHLHLCYTQSYWEDLCRDTLGKLIHHGPTRGGSGEAAKFTDWYEATLESYARLFGRRPPENIWPAPAERFRRTEWIRVDKSKQLLISKAAIRLSFLCALIAVFTMGCTMNSEETGVIAMIAVGVIVVCAIINRIGGGGGKSGGGCGGFFGCGGSDGCGGSGCGGCGS